MKSAIFNIIVFLILFLINIPKIYSCSVFCIDKKGNLVVGRSYDWSYEKGYFMVNKRGHEKIAFRYWEEETENLATWTSKYGSITENQYGRENSFGGMNEAGLVVHELWLQESEYSSADDRSHISVDQYVQYMLDNYATVNEIVQNISTIRIRPLPDDFTKIHFYAADSTGNCVIIDFLNGQPVYHCCENASIKAITNNTYEYSVNQYNSGISSRFYTIAQKLDDFNDSNTPVIEYAFETLDAVKQSITLFQTVYDIKNRRIYTRSVYAGTNIRYFDFDKFDFDCNTECKIFNFNTNTTGDVTDKFTNYTTEINEALIKEGWERLGYTDVYRPALQLISEYPETFKCCPSNRVNQNSKYHFEVIPNPAKNSILIGSPDMLIEETRYQILALTGKVVQQDQLKGYSINISSLNKGIYLLELNIADKIICKKIFKE